MEFHTLKGAVAAGNKDVPDSNKGISLKIRLYIRLFPLNEFGKVIVYN